MPKGWNTGWIRWGAEVNSRVRPASPYVRYSHKEHKGVPTPVTFLSSYVLYKVIRKTVNR